MRELEVILFKDFETLDVFGPVEVIGTLENFVEDQIEIEMYSEKDSLTKSKHGFEVNTNPISKIQSPNILLIPGGDGVRKEIENETFVDEIMKLAEKANFVLTVCTGSALLAKTGLIDGKNATSNKIAFDWVKSQNEKVSWVRKARWVKDGKFYTSSGVSAGIDMTLGFVKDNFGEEVSKKVSKYIEYEWDEDRENDPFLDMSSIDKI